MLSTNIKSKICRTIILPVVLYRCETWSLTLREERRLRTFENRVLTIYGPTGDKITGEWRKLHEELNDLYSPHIIGLIKSIRIRWAVHVARVEERTGAYWVLVGYVVERGHLEDLRVDVRIIIRWVFRKCGGGHGLN